MGADVVGIQAAFAQGEAEGIKWPSRSWASKPASLFQMVFRGPAHRAFGVVVVAGGLLAERCCDCCTVSAVAGTAFAICVGLSGCPEADAR